MRMLAAIFLPLFTLGTFTPLSVAASSKFVLSSPAFNAETGIAPAYTCEGKNVSPPLNWEGSPAGTQSFAVTLENLDAPKGVFTHWVLYGLPPVISNLPEGLPDWKVLMNGEKSGKNDFEEFGYGGPCFLKEKHRYVFTIFALDFMPKLDAGLTKTKLLEMIQGRILDTARLEVQYKPEK